jgi:8-oxo-dGTP pyrophosphatase MutT (NUDIX family)
MPEPHASIVDVMLLLTRGDQVLLALREGTGYADGQWNLPSGKLEAGEHLLAALARESAEEVGLTICHDEARFVGTVHYRNPEGHGRIGCFFHVTSNPARQGEPINAEPHKCAKIRWFPADMLPVNTVPYTAAGIELYRSGEPLAIVGWHAPTSA